MGWVRHISSVVGHGLDVLELGVQFAVVLPGLVSLPLQLDSDGSLEAGPLLASLEATPNLLNISCHPAKGLLPLLLKFEQGVRGANEDLGLAHPVVVGTQVEGFAENLHTVLGSALVLGPGGLGEHLRHSKKEKGKGKKERKKRKRKRNVEVRWQRKKEKITEDLHDSG